MKLAPVILLAVVVLCLSCTIILPRKAAAAQCSNPASVQSISGTAIIYKAGERTWLRAGDTVCEEDKVYLAEATVVKLLPADGSPSYELYTRNNVSYAALVGIMTLLLGIALIALLIYNGIAAKRTAAKVAMYVSAVVIGYELYFAVSTSTAFTVLFIFLRRA